jgi:hypothetical protein
MHQAEIEAAALLRAFGEGNAALIAAQDGLNLACDAVVESAHHAATAIDAVATFTAVGSVARARRATTVVAERHAQDGPEDLRRRPMRRWFVWATLIAAALFDASFVGNVMQRMLGVDGDSVAGRLAYLPGLGLALCLLAAGTVLGEHLFRHRVRTSRRAVRERLNPWLLLRRVLWHWRPERETRQPDSLPWPRLTVPVLFTAAVLALLAAAAFVRASQASGRFAELADLRPAFVVLLLLLSISAIAVKVLSHNPYADSEDRAKKAIRRAEWDAGALVRQARTRLAVHSRAWVRLQSAITASEGSARRIVEEACARILDDRGHRGSDCPARIPLAVLASPHSAEEASTESSLSRLDVGILDYAREVCDRYHPNDLKTQLSKLVDALNGQFGR